MSLHLVTGVDFSQVSIRPQGSLLPSRPGHGRLMGDPPDDRSKGRPLPRVQPQ